MPLFPDNTLFDLRGAVKQAKPNASKESIDTAINRAIRKLYRRHDWSDAIKIGSIALNQAYKTGTVTPSQGSTLWTGTGTAWPVNDAVNTNIPNGITETGYQEVAPGSMSGISIGSYLLVELSNPTLTEVVVVQDVTPTTFWASFSSLHGMGVAVQASSLAGTQFKAQWPIYTVKSVRSATSIEMDGVWGGASVTVPLAYYTYNGYVSPDPMCVRLKFAWDPNAAGPIDIWHSQEDLGLVDPQRTESNNPLWLAQAPASPAGVAQWEVWPAQLSPYLLQVIFVKQWPQLRNDADKAPPFFDPDVIISDARSQVLKIRTISRDSRQDPYYDPQAAQQYATEFEEGYEEMRQRDEGRSSTLLSTYISQMAGMNTYNWYQAHAEIQPNPFSGGPGGGW